MDASHINTDQRVVPETCKTVSRVIIQYTNYQLIYVTGFGKTLRMGSARDSRNVRFL